jgi:hypothetical protein
MTIRKTLGLGTLGLLVLLGAASDAAAGGRHRHHSRCGHGYVYHHDDYGYRDYGYRDYRYGGGYGFYEADPHRPYGRGWNGPYRHTYDDSPRYYRDHRHRYGRSGYDNRRFHYHGRQRCYRPHISLRLEF